MKPTGSNIVTFNNQKYRVEIFLLNFSHTPVVILWGGVASLVIEEDIHNWFYRGYIVVENSYEVFERPARDDEYHKSIAYTFRNDGKDRLNIKMIPVFDEVSDGDLSKESWELSFDFAVYDVQEILGKNPGEKYKKLYFWDWEYQEMLEKNVQFSTSELLELEQYKNEDYSIAQRPDDLRKVFTGDAIKYLIENNIKAQTFDKNWDSGSAKIFYTSPAKSFMSDDLDYLLSKHVSSPFGEDQNVDFALLRRRRNSKMWVLQPFAWYLKNSTDKSSQSPGILTFETFYLDEGVGNYDDKKSPSMPKAYHNKTLKHGLLDIDGNFGDYSVITKFSFVDMAGIDNMKAVVNRPVYYTDMKNGIFGVDFVNNNIDFVKSLAEKSYAKNFLQENSFNYSLTKNKTKTEMYNTDPMFSFSDNEVERYSIGRNLMLKSSVFLNSCINFTVKGLPLRTVGKFFSVERDKGFTDNRYDDRMLGTWFASNVKHIFTGNNYLNEVTGVKMYSYKNLEIEENI